MFKIKCDINQQDMKTVDLHFVKSEQFSLTWSSGSRQRDTTSSEWNYVIFKSVSDKNNKDCFACSHILVWLYLY